MMAQTIETRLNSIIIDEQKIKKILMELREPVCLFEVVLKDEKNDKVHGTYKYNARTITLYLLNFETYNQLIAVAIHEYAHHFMKWEGHRTNFWICYFELLRIAEKKGYYSCNINKSDKLMKITKIIKWHNLTRRMLKRKFECIFRIIYDLCNEIDVDFRYYTIKYMGMDWYKTKNPNLSFLSFYRWDVIFVNRKIEIDEYLKNFYDSYNI